MDKELLYQWYVVERMSYRQIMEKLGINNARKVKRLLTEAGIKPRERSEAIKTQWENNKQRRKTQSEKMSKISKGNKIRRISDEELIKKYDKKDLLFLYREIIKGFSYIHFVCKVCGLRHYQSLKNFKHGCPQCAINNRTFADQNTVSAQRSKTKSWRNKVINRDENCKKCGTNKNLVAHHKENFAQNINLRFEVDNGVTLCNECHKEFHVQYGYYENSTKQLEDFFQWKNC